VEKFVKLFEPLITKNIDLKNRFMVTSMESNLVDEAGFVTPALTDYWVARAKGGFGLLMLENSSVDPGGNVCAHSPGFFDDKFIPGLRSLTDAVHESGAKMGAQLGHSGRQTMPDIVGGQTVAPSPLPCATNGFIPKELTTEEVYEMIEKYGDAAVVAKKGGFDVVEIHGAHGYLLAGFMSAATNRRTDEFGGSFTNRMRFCRLIIENVRAKVGTDYPLSFRISADEKVPGGRELLESVVICRLLEEWGIDLINVSAALNPSCEYIVPPPAIQAGHLVPYAEKIKQAVSLPVICAGKLHEPNLASYVLESGKADIIGIGRGSLADPELPNKIKEGRIEEIAPCIGCYQGCYKAYPKPGQEDHILYTTTCLVNPFCCNETEMVIKPAAKIKNVMVIGGGPAGLEAAWVAAACGHLVTLYEKDRIGGTFRYAAIPPFKQQLASAIVYYEKMCEKYGVEMKLGEEVTDVQVLAENPDAVIVATGGTPIIPRSIPGADGENVFTAIEVLGGHKVPGKNVLVIGGGSVGCETADYLGEQRRNVTIVEMLGKIAADVSMQSLPFMMQRFKEYGIKTYTDTKVISFVDDGAVAEQNGEKLLLTGFDTIVLAMGSRPVNTLGPALTGKIAALYVIGDAFKARNALDAIEEGARTALKL
jgi:2,4-dienoyl-CoA reductase-like NADH-dependent reductase (Old Yellow Enzyme family)/thioredoxin reductase